MRNTFLVFCWTLVYLTISPISHHLLAQGEQIDTLLIADFEKGRNPMPNRTYLREWIQSPKQLDTEIDFYPLSQENAKYGKQAAKVSFDILRDRVRDWAGGGIVVEFPKVDLSQMLWVEFDMKSSKNAKLDDLKVKLESRGGCHSIELNVTEFADPPSEKWTHVKIPVKEFEHLRCENEDQEFLLSAVIKFVTVNVRDKDNPGLSGTLIVDNLMITKKKDIVMEERKFFITDFQFADFQQALNEEGEAFKIGGSFQSSIDDVLKLSAYLLLIDEFLDGVYIQTQTLFSKNGKWQSVVFPGKKIAGIKVIETTRAGAKIVADLKEKYADKIPESMLNSPEIKFIQQHIIEN